MKGDIIGSLKIYKIFCNSRFKEGEREE